MYQNELLDTTNYGGHHYEIAHLAHHEFVVALEAVSQPAPWNLGFGFQGARLRVEGVGVRFEGEEFRWSLGVGG